MREVYKGLIVVGILLGLIIGWPAAIGVVIALFVIFFAFIGLRMLWRL